MKAATHTFVGGKSAKYGAKNGIFQEAYSPLDLDVGSIGIYVHTGTELLLIDQSSANSYPTPREVYVCVGRKDAPYISEPINPTDIQNIARKDPSQGQNQVLTIGSDGSNGAIDIFPDEYYSLHVIENTYTPAGNIMETFDYRTPVSGSLASGAAAQYNAASTFARLINGDVQTYDQVGSQLITARVLSDGSINTKFATDLDIIKGSTLVIAGTDVTASGFSTTTAVGDILQVDGDTFTVEDIRNGGTELTLDRAVVNESKTITSGTSGTGLVTGASNFGIEATNNTNYRVDILGDGGSTGFRGGFANTPIREQVAYESPTNTGEQIYNLENRYLGNRGKVVYRDAYSPGPDPVADPDEPYVTWTIEFLTRVDSNATTGLDQFKHTLVVAAPETNNDLIYEFNSHVESYLNSAPNFDGLSL